MEGEFSCLLSNGDSFGSCSFGCTFWETIFLVEGYLLFVFLSFGSYWLIVTWYIVLLFHPLPSVLLGLFVHLPFSLSPSWLRHKSWGVLVYGRRYPKYSRLTLLLYPSLSCS
jgi:hypothetical protein